MFFGAGGYHHHIATNTWESRGGAALSGRAMGLVNFTLKLGDQTAVDALREHVRQTGWDTADADGGWRTRDPDGIAIQIGLVSG